MHKAVPAGKRNRLTPRVGSFFWPFQNALQTQPSPSSMGGLVLARLLLYLGKVVSLVPACEAKSRAVAALAEAVWVHRWNNDSHVVRSCMVGFVEALLSFPPEELVASHADIVEESVAWYTGMARDALDAETATVARACAAELSVHLSQLTSENET